MLRVRVRLRDRCRDRMRNKVMDGSFHVNTAVQLYWGIRLYE